MNWILIAILTSTSPVLVEVARYETEDACTVFGAALPNFADTELDCVQERIA